MQVALAEERKVTERLSRNLELEKRRVESLEQRAKTAAAARKAAPDDSGLPEELRLRDAQLSHSMERFRLQCEHLSSALEDCEGKLASFEIQVRNYNLYIIKE